MKFLNSEHYEQEVNVLFLIFNFLIEEKIPFGSNGNCGGAEMQLEK